MTEKEQIEFKRLSEHVASNAICLDRLINILGANFPALYTHLDPLRDEWARVFDDINNQYDTDIKNIDIRTNLDDHFK